MQNANTYYKYISNKSRKYEGFWKKWKSLSEKTIPKGIFYIYKTFFDQNKLL